VTASMCIAVEDAERAAVACHGIRERLQAAMAATVDHWLVTSDEERFRAAVGGVLLTYDQGSEEFARLQSEVQAIARMSAALTAAAAGVPVDWSSVTEGLEHEPFNIVLMWRQTKDRRDEVRLG
jgi:hypothetical protein